MPGAKTTRFIASEAVRALPTSSALQPMERKKKRAERASQQA